MRPQDQQLQYLLQNLYSRHRGTVAFIDESYRVGSQYEFPFYTVTSTILNVANLSEIRDQYFRTVGSHHWHTTDRFRNGEKEKIREFISLLSYHNSGLIVSIQVEIENGDLEHARRECLIQIVSRLSHRGCGLVVYERREDSKARNADASLFSKAIRNGFLPRNIRVFASSPSSEKLLWGPDLAGWAIRRYVAMNEIEWVLPFLESCEVIDASLGMTLKKKEPKPAAAKGFGPDSSVGQKGEEKNRSSLKSIAQFAGTEKGIFDIFPKLSNPLHEPALLRSWLLKEFPLSK